jgi:NAD(P) transhydrogenase subunit alpha
MVKSMKPGSVIVDLAAPQGGNCPLTEAGKTVVKHGVTIVGETNLAALVAADSSSLYARNVLDFLKLVLTKEGTFNVPMDDTSLRLPDDPRRRKLRTSNGRGISTVTT